MIRFFLFLLCIAATAFAGPGETAVPATTAFMRTLFKLSDAAAIRSALGITSASSVPVGITNGIVDFNHGESFTNTLQSNTTLALSNAVEGATIEIEIINPSTYTLTWPDGIKWFPATPSVSENGGTDIYYISVKGGRTNGTYLQIPVYSGKGDMLISISTNRLGRLPYPGVSNYRVVTDTNTATGYKTEPIPSQLATSGGTSTNQTLMVPINFVDTGGTNIGSIKSNVWTFSSSDAAGASQTVTMTVGATGLTFARTGSSGNNDVSITSGFRNVNLPSMTAGTGGVTVSGVGFVVNSGLLTQLLGGQQIATATKTANYTWSRNADHTLFVDATAGNVTITLPQNSQMTGREVRIIRTDGSGNTVTVTVSGGTELINGATTSTLTSQYQVKNFLSNGSQYYAW